MVNAFFYSNIAVPTTLSGNITNSATSATVGATTGWPTSYPFVIAIDFEAANEELVKVTNNVAGTLTIERGYGGTSAVAHSTGAVVRHVYNAQDATDARTHEAATGAVHGLTGSIVGTSDTQTLTNKTFSGGTFTGTIAGSPTLSGTVTSSGTITSSGGTFSGSWAGTPTFSGNVTFSGSTTAATITGEVALSNLLRGSRAASTDSMYESRVTGDANARWFTTTAGEIRWGPGTASWDTNLYRASSNTLATDDQFRSLRPNGTDVTWISQRSADSGARWYMTADGVSTWGDGAGAMDTNLYRSAADTLKTDDSLVVGGSITVSGTGQVLFAYKTADTTVTSSTTVSNDPHLSIAMAANTRYVLEGVIYYTSGVTTGDIKFGIDGPASVAGFWNGVAPGVASTADPDSVRTLSSPIGATVRAYGVSTAGQQFGVTISGMVETAGTAGNLVVPWAQNTSDATGTTMKIYSWLRLTKVA